jgi:hypothetical protein
VLESDPVAEVFRNSNLERCAMGDKSPKSKERQKKQQEAEKKQ